MTKVPLPSWADNTPRRLILEFVSEITRQGGRNYVPPADRIAVFDNDGTLWVEHPLYAQGAFALDRAKAMAGAHPELAATPVFQAFANQDLHALSACGKQAVMELLAHLHAYATEDSFALEVASWLAEARHPGFGRPYTDLAYQPMRELLAYLAANDFRNFIVTAGGADMVRAFSETVYGVPRERVIGSSDKIEFRLSGRRAEIHKLPALYTYNEYLEKPLNIARHIGRRPILAFGNSDGDLAMLQYTASGHGKRLPILLHHDDPEREYVYDKDTFVGKLDVALTTAIECGWTIVSMKNDWSRLFRDKTLRSRPPSR